MNVLFIVSSDNSVVYMDSNFISFCPDEDCSYCSSSTRGLMCIGHIGILDWVCSMSYGDYLRLIRTSISNSILDLSESSFKFHRDEEED